MIVNLLLGVATVLVGTSCTVASVPDLVAATSCYAPDPGPSLQARVQRYVGHLEGNYGVMAVDLDSGERVLVNADRQFRTASMYKLLVMYRVFQQTEAGRLSMYDRLTVSDEDQREVGSEDEDLEPGATMSVADAVEAMITVSSNAAAYALTREVGGWNAVASAAAELGMDDTVLDDGFWSTPADMARFFELLAAGSLLSESASRQMVALLEQQQVNDRMPALLPPGTPIAHKTGEVDDVRNDGGIVFGPRGSYVLVLMSSGIIPEDAVTTEAVVSRMVYDRYGR